MKKIEEIQFITDAKDSASLITQVEEIAKTQVNWIQFRMKDETYETKLDTGKKVREICHKYNKIFIVNDDVYIAKGLKADGIHLGILDMNPIKAREILGKDAIIGATCNNIKEIIQRAEQGVDYIGLGPFRFTTTKKKLAPTLGIEGYLDILSQMKERNINIPIIAIGGICTEDIKQIMQTGVHGIALSSLITRAENKKEIINQIFKAKN